MFSTKELVIKLTTQNAPPIKVVTRQPNRVTRAEDRCPVKKAKAIPTEPSHAKPSNKTSHMLLFFFLISNEGYDENDKVVLLDPLHPNISMRILHIVLFAFFRVPTFVNFAPFTRDRILSN